jgi:hypothetical protein
MLPFIIFATTVAAADPVRVTIKRIDADEPTFTLLLDVRDTHGTIVGDWASEDVTVTVDGEEMPVSRIDRFADSGEAFGTMLLFDTSCSMRRSMPQVHKAANDYIDGMTGGDTASFAWFNDASYGEHNPWSRNHDELRDLVSQLRAVGRQTRFYEALNKVLTEVDANPNSPRYRTVLVLSDGIDEGSPDPFTFDRAIRLSRANDIPINTVGFLPGRDRSGLPVLEALANDTDGYFTFAESESEISARLQQFQDSLHGLLLVEVHPGALPIGDREVAVSLSGAAGLGEARIRLELAEPWTGSEGDDEADEGFTPALLTVAASLLFLASIIAVFAFRRSSSSPPSEPPLPTPSPDPAPDPAPVNIAKHREPTRPLPPPPPISATAAPKLTTFRPAGAAMTVRLMQTDGHAVYLFQHGPQSILGSDPGRSDALIEAPTISGAHATFTFHADGRILIEDKGSTNGTYLSGVDIRARGPVAVQDQQQIQLGMVYVHLQVIG